MPDNPLEAIPARGGHVAPEPPQSFRVRITATGDYGRQIPPPLLAALMEEFAAHMKAYGIKEIQVSATGDV